MMTDVHVPSDFKMTQTMDLCKIDAVVLCFSERFVITGETELNFSFWSTVLYNRKSADAKVLLIKKAW